MAEPRLPDALRAELQRLRRAVREQGPQTDANRVDPFDGLLDRGDRGELSVEQRQTEESLEALLVACESYLTYIKHKHGIALPDAGDWRTLEQDADPWPAVCCLYEARQYARAALACLDRGEHRHAASRRAAAERFLGQARHLLSLPEIRLARQFTSESKRGPDSLTRWLDQHALRYPNDSFAAVKAALKRDAKTRPGDIADTIVFDGKQRTWKTIENRWSQVRRKRQQAAEQAAREWLHGR